MLWVVAIIRTMPTHVYIDAQRGIVFTKAVGALHRSDVLQHMEYLLKHPQFLPTFNQLLDFREVANVAVSGDEIRELARRRVFSPHSFRGFVVSTEEQFGVLRMFCIHREMEGDTRLGIFREMSAALSWLSLSAEPDCKLFSQLPNSHNQSAT
jgi:hypothetical protein